jgi:glycosyltransferase involved in cell wall biosynthesis
MTDKRILWVVNIPLPAACEALGLPHTPFGGWLSTMTQRLARVPGVRLGVAMRAPVEEVRIADVDGIRYYALPQGGTGGLDARDADCMHVLQDFQPDLLHAEGSEMAYTRRMLRAWSGPRLLSLQGVINGYEPFELGGLRPSRLLGSLRPRQMLAALVLPLNKRLRFDPRLAGEREVIASADHVMGRTPWDRAQAWALNPRARYHHCSRTLRDPFYTLRWCIEACERHTIFIGNAASARKGTHVALEALVLLHREYPQARLVVAGESPFATGHWLRRWFGYPAYLMDRIRQLGLQAHVEFTGLLDARGMAHRMARCHAYAMVSQIENSPNTLGEAMMLGMPCVSAFAGGAPGMAVDGHEALFYRPEDPAGLAYQLKRLLDSDESCTALGDAAHARAAVTHDADANLRDLLAAYGEILGGEVAA